MVLVLCHSNIINFPNILAYKLKSNKAMYMLFVTANRQGRDTIVPNLNSYKRCVEGEGGFCMYCLIPYTLIAKNELHFNERLICSWVYNKGVLVYLVDICNFPGYQKESSPSYQKFKV